MASQNKKRRGTTLEGTTTKNCLFSRIICLTRANSQINTKVQKGDQNNTVWQTVSGQNPYFLFVQKKSHVVYKCFCGKSEYLIYLPSKKLSTCMYSYYNKFLLILT